MLFQKVAMEEAWTVSSGRSCQSLINMQVAMEGAWTVSTGRSFKSLIIMKVAIEGAWTVSAAPQGGNRRGMDCLS